MKRIALILLVVAGTWAGCQRKAPEAATPPPGEPVSQVPRLPTHAQPKLKTIRLWLGAEELETELALTATEEHTGMMWRTNMPENTAMLFVFNSPQRANFWMANTLLPLSCAYIDPAGNILELHDMQPRSTNEIVAATPNIQYVLEVNQGWFKRHNVPVGTVIRTEYGSLHQTFFTRR